MRTFVAAIGLILVEFAMANPFDVLFEGGTVVDGTGAPPSRADVGIRDGRIVAIGDLDPADAIEVVDIESLVLAPGFIDVHSHADAALRDPVHAGIVGFLHQGVTTAVFGVDGAMHPGTMRDYVVLAEDGGVGLNFMAYAGHNGIRRDVMGYARRSPTPDELARMADMVEEAMENGAVGLSSGLMYQPGSFAETDELVALAKVVKAYGGRYDSHVRDPANELLASHQEALDIAEAAGIAAHPTHVKAVGGKNFGKGQALVELYQKRIDAGLDVTIDVYPYDGAATSRLVGLLRPADDPIGLPLYDRIQALQSGRAPSTEIPQLIEDLVMYWRTIEPGTDVYREAKLKTEDPPDGAYSWVETVGYQSMRVVVSHDEAKVGEMLRDLALVHEVTPFELVRRMVVEEGGHAMVTLGAIQELEVQLLLKQPWTMVASDGAEVDPQHPRGRGTFPRVLGRYVREWGVMTLEDAVFKMTGLPADYLKLGDRGVVRVDAVADLTVFDPERVIDRATWEEPERYSEGIVHVLIGGRFALRDGEVEAARHGRFIPFQGNGGSSPGCDVRPGRGG